MDKNTSKYLKLSKYFRIALIISLLIYVLLATINTGEIEIYTKIALLTTATLAIITTVFQVLTLISNRK